MITKEVLIQEVNEIVEAAIMCRNKLQDGVIYTPELLNELITHEGHQVTFNIEKKNIKRKVDPFMHMNPITLEYFIADLYGSLIIDHPEEWEKDCNLMIVLEDAIKALYHNCDLFVSIGPIQEILKDEHGLDNAEIIRIIILTVASSDGRHNMNYYMSKAQEFIDENIELRRKFFGFMEEEYTVVE